ncbi:hypothetical protein Ancab_035425 [Ancistrocladus abbreviatus]
MGKQIAIVGAGISGLLACKYTMEKGFRPVVFEASSGIGGVWYSQTISSTRLQTPKKFYQFSDFSWPSSVMETFPDHNQVMDYLQAYASHFHIFSRIKFNSKVIGIEYSKPVDEDHIDSLEFWGENGVPFSPGGKWNIVLEDTSHAMPKTEVYQVDFVILCIGKYSGLPHIPDFPKNQGPEAFDGKVLHSMDYTAMDDDQAADLIINKKITVVGFQKSAVDIAAEIARKNGASNPCTLVYKTAHWMVPGYLLAFMFQLLNRLAELMVHKPHEGLFLWLLAYLSTPLLWISSKLVESYLKLIYPLKKYDMVPNHGFLKQIASCIFTVLPADFRDSVSEGSLILKKSPSFSFSNSGLVIDGRSHYADMVIFATGYRSDEKLKSIFRSGTHQKFITESSAPLYRECIHPKIPQLAILGYSDSASVLFTTEMRSKWLSSFLAGNFKLPTRREMEKEAVKWQKCMQRYAQDGYKRTCASVLLQIYCNDRICKDMGCNPRRKKWLLAELFAPYTPADYKNL